MDNILKKNFEMSFIKSNQHRNVNYVNCNCQIFKWEIFPTLSLKFFSVDKITIIEKVKKFKI